MDRGRRFWVSFFTLALLIGIVFYLRQSNSPPARQIRSSLQQVVRKAKFIPTPTPYPYENLTIPYLREQIYKSNLEDLQQIDQNSSYTSYLASYQSDGLKINGLLTVPVGTAPDGGWPAVVFVHGFIPPKQYSTLERYTDYVDYLARNGFVVFKIDLRGNGDSDGTPAGAYFSSGYVIDTLNAYAALQSSHVASPSASSGIRVSVIPKESPGVSITPTPNPEELVEVNPKKIGLWGHSMAGNIVMRVWAVKPDIPAVVIWAGAGYSYTDLQKYRINDPSYQPNPKPSTTATASAQRQLQKLYGRPGTDNQFWHDMAPTSFLTDLKGAIQIDHAVDDPVVNIGYSRDLMKLFDKTKIPHTLYEYPTGGHNISEPSFTPAMQHTVDFYKKYLM
ncbi:MAG TPA: alpha/beta fold hydrolase [Candidatus Saccharimonadales bacterium]|nr:alpha/beta fold hydrolase [Candidatus Saccharimonadales bacterium]